MDWVNACVQCVASCSGAVESAASSLKLKLSGASFAALVCDDVALTFPSRRAAICCGCCGPGPRLRLLLLLLLLLGCYVALFAYRNRESVR